MQGFVENFTGDSTKLRYIRDFAISGFVLNEFLNYCIINNENIINNKNIINVLYRNQKGFRKDELICIKLKVPCIIKMCYMYTETKASDQRTTSRNIKLYMTWKLIDLINTVKCLKYGSLKLIEYCRFQLYPSMHEYRYLILRFLLFCIELL